MAYLEFLSATAFSWVALAALLAGWVVADLTRLPARHKAGRWAVSRLWTRIYVVLACAVACVPAAVFLSGPGALLDPRLLRFAGAIGVVGVGVTRFPRAFGVPAALIVVAAFSLLVAALRPWTPVSESGELFAIRVLSVTQGQQRLELLVADEGVDVVELEGNAFGVVMERLVVRPELFVLGFEVAYRPAAIEAYSYDPDGRGAVFQPAGDSFRFPAAENFFRRALAAGNIPGLGLQTAFSGTTEAHSLALHRVIVAPKSVELRSVGRDVQTSSDALRVVSRRGE